MITRFDHAVIAVRSLDEACRQFGRLGFDARPGGRHTGRGTENAIIRFGLDYIELISVYDEDEARRSGWGGAALVDYLSAHEGGLVGFCLATDDIESQVEPLRNELPETVGPLDMQRQRPNGETLHWRLLIPGRSPWLSPYPFLIEWALADTERLALEEPGRHDIGARAVAALTVGALKNELEDVRVSYRVAYELSETDREFRLGSFGIALVPSEAAGPKELTIKVDDIDASERWLTSRNIPVIRDAGGLRIDAAEACGAPMVLVA